MEDGKEEPLSAKQLQLFVAKKMFPKVNKWNYSKVKRKTKT